MGRRAAPAGGSCVGCMPQLGGETAALLGLDVWGAGGGGEGQ